MCTCAWRWRENARESNIGNVCTRLRSGRTQNLPLRDVIHTLRDSLSDRWVFAYQSYQRLTGNDVNRSWTTRQIKGIKAASSQQSSHNTGADDALLPMYRTGVCIMSNVQISLFSSWFSTPFQNLNHRLALNAQVKKQISCINNSGEWVERAYEYVRVIVNINTCKRLRETSMTQCVFSMTSWVEVVVTGQTLQI